MLYRQRRVRKAVAGLCFVCGTKASGRSHDATYSSGTGKAWQMLEACRLVATTSIAGIVYICAWLSVRASVRVRVKNRAVQGHKLLQLELHTVGQSAWSSLCFAGAHDTPCVYSAALCVGHGQG